jgi:hypothetical protein
MQTETVKDIDGNIYRTVMQGQPSLDGRELKNYRYNDGKSVPYVLSDEIWQKYDRHIVVTTMMRQVIKGIWRLI